MKKSRVCHFSSVHNIDDTRVFHRECVSLAKTFDVTFIGIGDKKEKIKGVQVIGIQASKSRIFRLFSSGYKAFSEAIKTDANIFHIHDPEMIPFGILLSISGKIVIYDIHENSAGDIQYREWIPKRLRNLISNTYNLLLRAANNYLYIIPVISNNRFKEKLFLKDGNFTVIQNYVPLADLREFRKDNRSEIEGNEILYAGLIQDHYYNIHPLLEAIEILNKKDIQTKLHVAGNLGWGSFDEIMEQHPELDTNQVKFYGKLKQEEVFKLSQKCKIGICLKNQPDELVFSHERKLFEYIGLGLPSIFCNQRIYQELNLESEIGISVNLKSGIEISEAISDLLLNKIKQEELAKNGLIFAEKITNWETEYLKLENCYINLISAN